MANAGGDGGSGWRDEEKTALLYILQQRVASQAVTTYANLIDELEVKGYVKSASQLQNLLKASSKLKAGAEHRAAWSQCNKSEGVKGRTPVPRPPGRQSPLAAWCHFKMNPPFEEEEDDVEGEEGGALDHVAGLDGLIARIVIGRAVQKEVVLLKEANEAMIQGEERENAAADEMQAVEEEEEEEGPSEFSAADGVSVAGPAEALSAVSGTQAVDGRSASPRAFRTIHRATTVLRGTVTKVLGPDQFQVKYTLHPSQVATGCKLPPSELEDVVNWVELNRLLVPLLSNDRAFETAHDASLLLSLSTRSPATSSNASSSSSSSSSSSRVSAPAQHIVEHYTTSENPPHQGQKRRAYDAMTLLAGKKQRASKDHVAAVLAEVRKLLENDEEALAAFEKHRSDRMEGAAWSSSSPSSS